MVKRTLGRSGIEVSGLGMGCWAIGGTHVDAEGNRSGWGKTDDAESIRTVHAALDAGITLFDTAEAYGKGHSEDLLGRCLQGRRAHVVIATKFSLPYIEGRPAAEVEADIRHRLAGSLGRLRTDYIDIYQCHNGTYPPAEAPVVRDICQKLAEEGSIRWYGWSTDDAQRAAVFAEGPHCTSIQFRLNVLQRNDPMLALLAEQGLAGLNKGPLIKGMLTGKFTHETTFPETDVRGRFWDLAEGYEAELLDRFEQVREVLASTGRSLAQASLGWIWAHDPNAVPIPGCKTVRQVQDNAGSLQHGPLPAETMQRIEKILA
jgi:aryl-alcohol dehydrogenase-like predicted oxidoreductase